MPGELTATLLRPLKVRKMQKSQPNEDERSDISEEILRSGALGPNMTSYLQNIFKI